MRKVVIVLLGAFVVAVATPRLLPMAEAQPSTNPAAQNGHKTLTGNATAVAVPTSSISKRYGVGVQNWSANRVCCGWTAATATCTYGWLVPPMVGDAPGERSFSVGFEQAGVMTLYCWSATTSEIAWMELR